MSRTPRFRIHTVAEMTGIPASTLRAWERRYGIPSPERTPSAYRLYSEDDVAVVRRMKSLCDGGVAPSEASRLVLATQGDDATPAPARAPSDPYEESRRRIVEAVMAFDPAMVRMEVARATFLGCASAVFEHVLGPAMRTIGQRWHDGQLSVAQEHLASEVLLGTARDLHRLVQSEQADRVVLLACVAGELHSLPLYGVAFRLASWGYRTEILGSDTPAFALADAVQALAPQVVGLSMTLPRPESEVASLLDAYASAIGPRPWLVGGAAAARYEAMIMARGGIPADEEMTGVRLQIERALLGGRREDGALH